MKRRTGRFIAWTVSAWLAASSAAGALARQTQPAAPAEAAPAPAPATQPAEAATGISPAADPQPGQAFLELARRHRCERFADLLTRSGMAGVTAGENQVTLFMPTDAAFLALPETVQTALESGDVLVLRRLLSGHVGWGHAAFTKIGPTAAVRTVAGNLVYMKKEGSDWSVAGAKVIFGDQAGGPALVHIIDGVLLPPRWSEVDQKELQTDSAIAMSGRGGGMVHAAGCPLASPSSPPAAVVNRNSGGNAATGGPPNGGVVKPERPRGPRGAFESATVGDPVPPPAPPEPPPEVPESRASAAGGNAPTTGDSGAGNGGMPPGAPACTCGLLPG